MHDEFDPETDVDISGLERWEVLRALHANTRALGMGRIHDRDMTDEDAKELIGEATRIRFDYVFGRPMKVGFVKTWITRVDLYDRDSKRPAREIIEELRAARSRIDA